MEKYIAIFNPGKNAIVREIDNPNMQFEKLARDAGVTNNADLKVITANGETQKPELSDRITEYFQTKTADINGTPRKYKCLEMELKQNLDFWQYCKNTSCIITNRQIYELSKTSADSLGTLRIFGHTFYITEKNPHVEINMDESTMDLLMRDDYFNYHGNMYPLQEGKGEVELNGKSYSIVPQKQEIQNNGNDPFKLADGKYKPQETETIYRETREVTIRRKY